MNVKWNPLGSANRKGLSIREAYGSGPPMFPCHMLTSNSNIVLKSRIGLVSPKSSS